MFKIGRTLWPRMDITAQTGKDKRATGVATMAG
jgi:hypothetical protein